MARAAASTRTAPAHHGKRRVARADTAAEDRAGSGEEERDGEQVEGERNVCSGSQRPDARADAREREPERHDGPHEDGPAQRFPHSARAEPARREEEHAGREPARHRDPGRDRGGIDLDQMSERGKEHAADRQDADGARKGDVAQRTGALGPQHHHPAHEQRAETHSGVRGRAQGRALHRQPIRGSEGGQHNPGCRCSAQDHD